MKKVLVAAVAVALAVAMCVPASAFESEFGGYWRTRAYTNQDFSGSKGDNDVAGDLQQVDTRTRLYYTAKFSDDFKFVNKFEFNSVWGDSDGGDIGADGSNFKVKNSYVDYNYYNLNFKIGTQAAVLGRAFLFDDDFSGAVITGKYKDITIPVYWMKVKEGGQGNDMNEADMDVLAVSPEYKTGNMIINPFLLYAFQSKIEPSKATWSLDDTGVAVSDNNATAGFKDYNVFDLGVSVDMALDAANVWATLVYQFGSYDKKEIGMAVEDRDVSAYLIAFGGNIDVEEIDVHGQFLYASGDSSNNDSDDEAFADLTGGGTYVWAEIMGEGLFDGISASNGSCGTDISNLMAFNVGASMSPMEKLTVGADLWYAGLVEDDAAGENYLGTELDLSASYKVMDNLDLDVVAAYLFAGDATGDENPMEVGAQLSFSF